MNEKGLSWAEVDALSDAPFTYDSVGTTGAREAPAGYRRVRHSRVIGRGEPRFTEASRRLLEWEMHSRAGVRVEPSLAGPAGRAVQWWITRRYLRAA